jgi:hypothetical protein
LNSGPLHARQVLVTDSLLLCTVVFDYNPYLVDFNLAKILGTKLRILYEDFWVLLPRCSDHGISPILLHVLLFNEEISDLLSSSCSNPKPQYHSYVLRRTLAVFQFHTTVEFCFLLLERCVVKGRNRECHPLLNLCLFEENC